MNQQFYAVRNKDDSIRLVSSSGGVFYTIAKSIIKENGIVYGAVYDEEFNVIHQKALNEFELKQMLGSKYVHSQLKNCFKEIKEYLKQSRKVLFSGTPCQIKALSNYLKNEDVSNLFLIDIICHGTPSTVFFEEYKNRLEKKYKSKITNINMRYKDEKKYNSNKKNINYKSLCPVEKHVMKVEFENNKVYICNSDFDNFYIMFDYFTQKGCFKCPFANLYRVSDLTIGDFHEFSSKLGDFNDGNGVSLLIINSLKGRKIFDNVKEQFEYCEKNVGECIQPALQCAMKRPIDYDNFINDYEKFGYDYIIKRYAKDNLKRRTKEILYNLKILEKVKKIIKK